jgi:hypothetical protein
MEAHGARLASRIQTAICQSDDAAITQLGGCSGPHAGRGTPRPHSWHDVFAWKMIPGRLKLFATTASLRSRESGL